MYKGSEANLIDSNKINIIQCHHVLEYYSVGSI